MMRKTAIIIGTGPAGLTAAYELLHRTDIKPILFETMEDVGGICRTINYKGNRMDIGGHRFYSKSDRIMRWWLNILPLQGALSKDDKMLGRSLPLSKEAVAPDPEKTDRVSLFRYRVSRIYYLRRFFDYPIQFTFSMVTALGIIRITKIILSLLKVKIFPIKNEISLEDFLINRFGKELYKTFFKDYTEKVWGVSCEQISKDWGVQRVKGVSIKKLIFSFLKRCFFKNRFLLAQKDTETSLIECFIYPKYGPGQMWSEVARIVCAKEAELRLRHRVIGLQTDGLRVSGVEVEDLETKETKAVKADYIFSSAPLRDLIKGMGKIVPAEVRAVAEGLKYRDFMSVGLLLRRMKIRNETKTKTINNILPDLWIYIQDKEVKIGRLQIFNNWSPYLITDEDKVWVGAEYFCNYGDGLWNLSDTKLVQLAISELVKISVIATKEDVLDSTVFRMRDAYPAYFGTYGQLPLIKEFLDRFENLFLIGRNGMHRYNNMDHSMLSAMTAVDNVVRGIKSKNNIWNVNTEKKYAEFP